MEGLGKGLVALGLVLVALGALLSFGPAPTWLGRLPGDLRIERPGFRLHVPFATSALLSLLLTALLWLWSRVR